MKRALVVAAALLAAACGSSSSTAPTPNNTTSAPSSFSVTLQQVSISANTIAFSWASTGATTYKIFIGTASGGSDALAADVSGTTYTWTGPRTAGIYFARVAAVSGGTTGTASTELPIFTLDMRNMIDAFYFAAGPMSQNATINPTPFNAQISSAIWTDGTALTVLVTSEAGATSLSNAQRFVSDYLAATGNHISATVSVTSTDYHGVAVSALPENTVVVRVDQVCPGVGVIACANFGPTPIGNNRSFVNLNSVLGAPSVSHEIGHSFGLNHMAVSTGTRAEFAFLMNPALVGSQLTDAEKAILSAARAGGMRNGWTRAQALAQNLVLPYTGGVIAPPPMLMPSAHDIESMIIR